MRFFIDNLQISVVLSFVATLGALVALWFGPGVWRLSALWVYLVTVAGMCLGLMFLGTPTPEVAGVLECCRALLAVLVALEIGRRAGSIRGARQRWVDCRFQILCYTGIAWALGLIAERLSPHPAVLMWGYRGVAMVDLAAAAALLTVWARLSIPNRQDEITVHYLGIVYALHCCYRLLWQVGPAHAQFFGWAATVTYCITMVMIGAAALEEWADR